MTREQILYAARDCVTGQRVEDYGKVEDNFATIAEMWTTYMEAAKCVATGVHVELLGEDVALMMALLKIARATTSDNMDKLIDLAGYAACAGELIGGAES